MEPVDNDDENPFTRGQRADEKKGDLSKACYFGSQNLNDNDNNNNWTDPRVPTAEVRLDSGNLLYKTALTPFDPSNPARDGWMTVGELKLMACTQEHVGVDPYDQLLGQPDADGSGGGIIWHDESEIPCLEGDRFVFVIMKRGDSREQKWQHGSRITNLMRYEVLTRDSLAHKALADAAQAEKEVDKITVSSSLPSLASLGFPPYPKSPTYSPIPSQSPGYAPVPSDFAGRDRRLEDTIANILDIQGGFDDPVCGEDEDNRAAMTRTGGANEFDELLKEAKGFANEIQNIRGLGPKIPPPNKPGYDKEGLERLRQQLPDPVFGEKYDGSDMSCEVRKRRRVEAAMTASRRYPALMIQARGGIPLFRDWHDSIVAEIQNKIDSRVQKYGFLRVEIHFPYPQTVCTAEMIGNVPKTWQMACRRLEKHQHDSLAKFIVATLKCDRSHKIESSVVSQFPINGWDSRPYQRIVFYLDEPGAASGTQAQVLVDET